MPCPLAVSSALPHGEHPPPGGGAGRTDSTIRATATRHGHTPAGGRVCMERVRACVCAADACACVCGYVCMQTRG